MIAKTTDERAGLPSASGIERLVACPGSFQAEQGMPPLPELPVTAQGTDIHEAMETGDSSGLEEDEARVVERLNRLEDQAVRDWSNSRGLETEAVRHAEKRLWIRDRRTLDLLASAKLDVFYVHGVHCVIIDFKSGYKKPTASDLNWQLLTQALALWHEHPELETFRVAIAASRLSSTLDLAEYQVSEIIFAEQELHRALWKAKQPNPPRVPGTWCQYCRANGHCAEAASYSSLVLFNTDLKAWDKLSIIEAVSKMEPAQMAHVWVRSKIATIIFDNIEARLKNLSPEDLQKIGLKLKPGAEKRALTDVPKAWEIISTLLPYEDLRGIISIPLGKLTKALAKAKGLKEKDATALLHSSLEGLIETKQNKPSLEIME